MSFNPRTWKYTTEVEYKEGLHFIHSLYNNNKQLINVNVPNNFTIADGNELANKFGQKIIRGLPRYGGDKELNIPDDIPTTAEQLSPPPDYILGIASLIVACLLVPVISFAICPIFCLCRCCKCCCCKRKKPKKEISACDIWGKYFFILACAAIMVIFVGIGYYANKDFSGSLVNNTGSGVENSLWNIIIQLKEEIKDLIAKIAKDIGDLKTPVNDVIDQVAILLNDTTIISTGTSVLIGMLGNVSDKWNNYEIRTSFNGENYTFPCDFCTTIATTVGSVKTEIQSATDPIFANLDNEVSAVQNELVSQKSTIGEQIDSFVDVIDGQQTTIDDMFSIITDQESIVRDINKQRELAYNIMFVVPLLPFLFILLGGILKFQICFSISYMLLWFGSVLLFLLLSLHLPIAIILGDGCVFLTQFESNATKYLGNGTGKIVDACFANEKLTAVFGLEAFNFADLVQFDDIELGDAFSFGQLASFEQDANATGEDTFMSNGNAAMIEINGLITNCSCPHSNDVFNRTNVGTMNETKYYPTNTLNPQTNLENANKTVRLIVLKNTVLAEEQTIASFTTALNGIRSDLDAVQQQANELENKTKTVVNKVNNAEHLIDPLIVSIEGILEHARCGWITEFYNEVKTVLCSGVVGALSRICVAMGVIAILSIISCCCSFKLVRKFYWRKHYHEFDDMGTNGPMNPQTNIQMQAQPQNFQL